MNSTITKAYASCLLALSDLDNDDDREYVLKILKVQSGTRVHTAISECLQALDGLNAEGTNFVLSNLKSFHAASDDVEPEKPAKKEKDLYTTGSTVRDGKTVSQLSEEYKINKFTLLTRLNSGWDIDDALTRPIRPRQTR
jgi:nucleoid-associated protein YejK